MQSMIEELKKEVGNEQMPTIYKDTVDVADERFPNMPKRAILEMFDTLVARMINFKHAAIDNSGETLIPNNLALILIRSGMGKDRTFNFLDKYVFKQFNEYFDQMANKIYQEQMQQYEYQVLEDKFAKQQVEQEIKEKLDKERETKDDKGRTDNARPVDGNSIAPF